MNDLYTRKERAVEVFLTNTGQVNSTTNRSSVCVFSFDEVVELAKRFSKDDHTLRGYHFETIAEITDKAVDDVQSFFLADIMLGNDVVSNKEFVDGTDVNRFIAGWMTEDEFTESFANLCVKNKDFADFLSPDYMIIDGFYVFQLDV